MQPHDNTLVTANQPLDRPQNLSPSREIDGSDHTEAGKITAIAAISEGERKQRLDLAKAEALKANDAMEVSEAETDKAGWVALRAMVSLAETFAGEDAIVEFYQREAKKKVHGNTKNAYQLISKVCFPQETRSDRVTRFGQALAAVVGQGISSERVVDELSQSKPIAEPARKASKHYTGINRFVLLFKHEERLRRQAEAAAAEPETVVRAADDNAIESNPYLAMPEDALRAQAVQIIQAIQERKIISLNLLKVEAALRSAG